MMRRQFCVKGADGAESHTLFEFRWNKRSITQQIVGLQGDRPRL